MLTQKILLNFDPKKENVLPILREIQEKNAFVSEKAIRKIANYLDMKEAEVFSVASFYNDINTKKPVMLIVKVCDGANCSSKGAERVLKEVERFFSIKAGDDFNSKVKIERESCFGLCNRGPVMFVNGTIFEKVQAESVDEILKAYF